MSREDGGPRVSILMPNMNNAPVLDEVLESIERHTTYPDFELIVSDDGSTDGSVEILRRWRDSGRFRDFTLLEREHAGIIPTLNAALDVVGGDMIVRVDGDTTVETPGWLERMLAFHASDDRIGVSVAKVIIDTGHVHMCGIDVVVPEGLHDRGTRLLEPAGARTIAVDTVHPLEEESELVDEPAEVDSVLGCWTAFPTELAREIGGWDIGYNPVWYEDIDFALAARAAGLKVFYFPEVRVVHHLNRRKPRLKVSPLRRALGRAGLRFGGYVPERLRRRIAGRAGLGAADPGKVALLTSHREHWRGKWGWDPLNPDLEAIRARWDETEVWWRHDPERRAAGKQILAGWARRPESSPTV
jgi:GT2 family glycosyltransferase